MITQNIHPTCSTCGKIYQMTLYCVIKVKRSRIRRKSKKVLEVRGMKMDHRCPPDDEYTYCASTDCTFKHKEPQKVQFHETAAHDLRYVPHFTIDMGTGVVQQHWPFGIKQPPSAILSPHEHEWVEDSSMVDIVPTYTCVKRGCPGRDA